MLMGLGAYLWKRRSRLKYLCQRRSKNKKLVRLRGSQGPRRDALDSVGARREALSELEDTELGDGSEKYGVTPDDEIHQALWETRIRRSPRHGRVSELDVSDIIDRLEGDDDTTRVDGGASDNAASVRVRPGVTDVDLSRGLLR